MSQYPAFYHRSRSLQVPTWGLCFLVDGDITTGHELAWRSSFLLPAIKILLYSPVQG